MRSEKFIRYLKLAFGAAFLGFFALLCVPFASMYGAGAQRVAVYVIAGVFWLSVIFEQEFLRRCSRERSRMQNMQANSSRRRRIREEASGSSKRFFKNRESAAAALVFLAAAILNAALAFLKIQSGSLVITSIGILFLSLNLYLIFNGRNYKYMKRCRGGEEK